MSSDYSFVYQIEIQHTHLIMCLASFPDYRILERHLNLEKTIGVLDMEVESYELSKLMAWVFYPTWILLTIVQTICFILYNGKFHPLSKILDGCEVQRKGISELGLYFRLFVTFKQLTLLKKLTSVHCKPIPCNENRVFPVKFSHRGSL